MTDQPPSADEAMAKLFSMSRPAACGTILDTAPEGHASRVGGPAWLPSEADWPTDEGGAYLLLAAIDFAEFGPLPGFPADGLLQVFIGAGELYGADFDDLAAGRYAIRYDPGTALGGLNACSPPGGVADEAPIAGDVQAEGRAISFAIGEMAPSMADRAAIALMDAMPEDAAEALYDAYDARVPPTPDVWLGGHPDFTQDDVRRDRRYREHTEVLLQVSVSDAVMFGDSGEASFLIRPADLAAGRYERAVYTWDCC